VTPQHKRDQQRARTSPAGRPKRAKSYRTKGEAMAASVKASIRHHGEYSPFLRKKLAEKINDGACRG